MSETSRPVRVSKLSSALGLLALALLTFAPGRTPGQAKKTRLRSPEDTPPPVMVPMDHVCPQPGGFDPKGYAHVLRVAESNPDAQKRVVDAVDLLTDGAGAVLVREYEYDPGDPTRVSVGLSFSRFEGDAIATKALLSGENVDFVNTDLISLGTWSLVVASSTERAITLDGGPPTPARQA